jgi:phage tail sheath protein FI
MNRVAVIDLPDSPLRSTLVAAAVALRGVPARFAGAFAPWVQVPGITPGTIRTVPYSAVQAGMIARNDVSYSANVAAAGDRGVSSYAIGLSQPSWTEADRQALNDAGVNVAINRFGGIRTYGYRTLVNKDTDSNWISLGNSRLLMQIAALGDEIMETHVFDQIDGQGHLFSVIHSELDAMVQPFYSDGSLFGATPEEAYLIDTSEVVNTPATIAAREIHAVIAVRTSPFGEMVELDLVKVSVADSLV